MHSTMIKESFLTALLILLFCHRSAANYDICTTAPFSVYRDTADREEITNATKWVVGYHGKLYKGEAKLEEKLRHDSLYYFYTDLTLQNKEDVVVTAKQRLLEGPGIYKKGERFDNVSSELFEIKYFIHEQEWFVSELRASIPLPDNPGKYRYVFGNSWWRFFCATYITVEYCSVEEPFKPTVKTGPGSYNDTGMLTCESNEKLVHVNGSVFEGYETTCMSDANWKYVDQLDCWTILESASITGNFDLKEGQTLRLSCNAEGLALVEEVWYFVDGNRTEGVVNEPLEIQNVDEEQYDGKKVYCQVASKYTEKFGEVRSETKTLNVKYPPRGDQIQSCILTKEGVCYIQFRSNPDASNIVLLTGFTSLSNISSLPHSKNGHYRNWSITFQDAPSTSQDQYILEVKSSEFDDCMFNIRLQLSNPHQYVYQQDAEAIAKDENQNVSATVPTVFAAVFGGVIGVGIVVFIAMTINKKNKNKIADDKQLIRDTEKAEAYIEVRS